MLSVLTNKTNTKAYTKIQGEWKLTETDMGGWGCLYDTFQLTFKFSRHINTDVELLDHGSYEIEFSDNNSVMNSHKYMIIDGKRFQHEKDGDI